MRPIAMSRKFLACRAGEEGEGARMRILVTGGAGFIGTNLVAHLANSGRYEIQVLDDLSAGQDVPRFPSGVRFRRGDFTDATTLRDCLKDVQIIVHLAAMSGVVDSIVDPERCFAINVAGGFRLLEMAREAKVEQVINASTGGALLGDVAPPISEMMAPSPMSPYGASKLAIEGFCSAFAASYGVACATLRFSNIYGPHSAHKKTVVAAFIKNALRREPLVVYGDGEQQRDYLFVGDLVRGIEQAIERGTTGTFQLGAGRPTSLRELIAILERVAGRTFEVRFEPARRGEVRATWCDIAKARRELGFAPTSDLASGLTASWAWFGENRDAWMKLRVLTSAD